MEYNVNNIRNFSIIAHIDSGKSTLADRFLELTGTVPKEKMRPQYLDAMDLERGRGITIKMHPVRMVYRPSQILNPKSEILNNLEIRNSKLEIANSEYILNLIDTPGHVDFNYEVSRSLAAVEGAILLVDATRGIQAQTIANLELAKKQNLVIIPAVNKIDSPYAKIEETKKELVNLLNPVRDYNNIKEHNNIKTVQREQISNGVNVSSTEIFEISAKYGTNVEKLLQAVIEKIPAPNIDVNTEKTLRALIFDSKYDVYKGVVAFVRVSEGSIKLNEKIYLLSNKVEGKIKEIGYFKPDFSPQEKLEPGEIGYIATGIKEPGKVRVGDTITKLKVKNEKLKIIDVEPLTGYQEPKPMVFAAIYPENPDDYELLKEGIVKLKLNDPSFTFEPERKEELGRGFSCGFLGTLHAEILSQRLREEFGLSLIISPPQVLYKAVNQKGKEILIHSPSDWISEEQIKQIKEPWVKLEIITPNNYLGQVIEIVQNFGGKQKEIKFFSEDKTILIYQIGMGAIVTGFYDKLKEVSQGFASMNYQFLDYRAADLVKLEILIASRKEEALSRIVYRDKAYLEGKKIISKLKEILPSQLFSVSLQASFSGKIIARETLKARGKDVIAPLYGGDYTRKRKLLEKQKKGKKELKEKGRVHIPSNVFFEIFRG